MFNYYDELGVKRTSTKSEIKSAYRALGKKYHPDVHPGDKKFAENKMKRINVAYETLSNPEKRNLYDQSLSGSFFAYNYGFTHNNNTEHKNPNHSNRTNYGKADAANNNNDVNNKNASSHNNKNSNENNNINNKNSDQSNSKNADNKGKASFDGPNAKFTKKSPKKFVKITVEMKEEIYQNALNIMKNAKSDEDYTKAAGMFKKIIGYKNAYFTGVECENIANKIATEKTNVARKEEIYQKGLEAKNNSKTKYDFLNAKKIFAEIRGYKDADILAKECLLMSGES